jgi:hypothetical protein
MAVTAYDQGPGVSMFRWVPGLQVISSYRSKWLPKDIVAGVVLTTLLVPQGMAYAELAGLPPITGPVHLHLVPARVCGAWLIPRHRRSCCARGPESCRPRALRRGVAAR